MSSTDPPPSSSTTAAVAQAVTDLAEDHLPSTRGARALQAIVTRTDSHLADQEHHLTATRSALREQRDGELHVALARHLAQHGSIEDLGATLDELEELVAGRERALAELNARMQRAEALLSAKRPSYLAAQDWTASLVAGLFTK
ncbi:hypothetical protein IWQ60_001432 [Tieghemiomyces parasiticus]|uniref:Uncharacterized protein n=1 Tax=Tieghemiomyces parasiticus TaxID=78921 RepID=A0A9W8AD19_9FUNG|nr:hypothetical protein IWQ60_001432 [Tieghemiomyces parasiticus]